MIISEEFFYQVVDFFKNNHKIKFKRLEDRKEVYGKYYYQNGVNRKIEMAFRINRDNNFDHELAIYIHELGHDPQYKELPDLIDPQISENVDFQKVAWDEGWLMFERHAEKESWGVDLTEFQVIYKKVKEKCIRTYIKKENKIRKENIEKTERMSNKNKYLLQNEARRRK